MSELTRELARLAKTAGIDPKLGDAEVIAKATEIIMDLKDVVDDVTEYINLNEKIIKGMYPVWNAAVSWARHSHAADLDRIRNYNPASALTSEQTDQINYVCGLDTEEEDENEVEEANEYLRRLKLIKK